jgi:hypothetical protein
MNCRCLRCDQHFTLSEDEAAHCREHYERRGLPLPAETVGICDGCWQSGESAVEPADAA